MLKVFGKLSNQMMICFAFIIFIIILLLTLIPYFNFKNKLLEDYIEKNINYSEYGINELDLYVRQLDDLALLVRKEEGLMNMLKTENVDSIGLEYRISNQLSYLYYSRMSLGDLRELKMYVPYNGKEYIIRNGEDVISHYRKETVEESAAYQHSLNDKYYRDIEADDAKEGTNRGTFMVYYKMIINVSNKRPLLMITFRMNDKMIRSILNSLYEPGETIAIINADDQLLYINDPSKEAVFKEYTRQKGGDERSMLIQYNHKDYLFVSSKSQYTGWILVKTVPLDVVYQEAERTRTISLNIGGILLIIALIMTYLISFWITKPLKTLIKEMDKVSGGNLNVNLDIRGSTEIIELSDKFSSMAKKLDTIINEEYRLRISEKNAQLKALEAQINPHFLYNTLQSMATKALESGVPKVYDMGVALAGILRYCIKSPNIIQVQQEIQNVEKYLMLQKTRYEERLDYEIYADKRVMKAYIPKLILQILVENAIIHCVETTDKTVSIRICVRTENNKLYIKVSDDGEGIKPEKLNNILKHLNSSMEIVTKEGIGLANIYNRLKMLYNDSFSFDIQSKPGTGTEIIIKMPQVWHYGKKEENNR